MNELGGDAAPRLTLTGTGAGLGASLGASFLDAFLEDSLGAGAGVASFLETLTFLLSDLAILIVMKGIKKVDEKNRKVKLVEVERHSSLYIGACRLPRAPKILSKS